MMKFRVERTSQLTCSDENTQAPCVGATREVIKRDGDARDIVIWTIELATLEELMAFILKTDNGKFDRRAVIWPQGEDGPMARLEIYDYWRE